MLFIIAFLAFCAGCFTAGLMWAAKTEDDKED